MCLCFLLYLPLPGIAIVFSAILLHFYYIFFVIDQRVGSHARCGPCFARIIVFVVFVLLVSLFIEILFFIVSFVFHFVFSLIVTSPFLSKHSLRCSLSFCSLVIIILVFVHILVSLFIEMWLFISIFQCASLFSISMSIKVLSLSLPLYLSLWPSICLSFSSPLHHLHFLLPSSWSLPRSISLIPTYTRVSPHIHVPSPCPPSIRLHLCLSLPPSLTLGSVSCSSWNEFCAYEISPSLSFFNQYVSLLYL